MRVFSSIVRSLLFKEKELPNYLGRWRVNHCKKTINQLVDQANRDHCGPCGVNQSNEKTPPKYKVIE
jgi:hypothetical protein